MICTHLYALNCNNLTIKLIKQFYVASLFIANPYLYWFFRQLKTVHKKNFAKQKQHRSSPCAVFLSNARENV